MHLSECTYLPSTRVTQSASLAAGGLFIMPHVILCLLFSITKYTVYFDSAVTSVEIFNI